MELTYATIVVLASMIFVLAGMIGYLYWQQTRMMQHLNSIAIVVSTHFAPRPLQEEEKEEEKQEEVESEEEEDDRVSIKEEIELVEGPKEEPTTQTKVDEEDVDDLQDKTAAQLRELLTKKGIPFGKRDPKTVLIQLLKATA